MNILLTSVGRRTYMINYFKEALKDSKGKVFASNSVDTYALHQADSYTLTPAIYSDKYIDYLIGYCQDNEISLIISLFDIDLPILAKNKDIFKKNNINVMVSDSDVTDICNDKWKAFDFFTQHGIKTPKTYIELSKAKFELESGELNFPVIIKPRWGMGSIGIYKADSLDELNVLYSKVRNEIESSYLRFESKVDIEYAILIQECIQGDEYGIEIINDLDKNYVTTLCKKKIAMRSGETDQAMTLKDEKLESIGKAISSSLGHISILDADCLEKNGDYYVLEMNARFGGQYPFSHLAGANVPKQVIDWYEGKNTDTALLTIEANVLCSKDIIPVRNI